MEQALRHMSAVVEFSDDAIISKDLNGIITTWNRGAQRIFGYSAEEAIGRSVTMLIPEDHANEEAEILKRIRAGERIEHYETVRKRKDGKLLNISLTVSPVKNEGGQVIGASKIARDVTERVNAEMALAESLKREKAATLAKDHFIAMLSHELRAPLNPALLLASEGARNRAVPEEVREQFEVICSNIKLEASLIDDLLDINRITHGKLQVEKQAVELHEVIRNALNVVYDASVKKRIEIHPAFAAQECVVMGDPVRLQQVFWNILSNAVKFTPEGGKVTVTTTLLAEQIRVQIIDTGIGMLPEDRDKIFGLFVQAEHGNETDCSGGLGIGLAIAKMLVDLHSGHIKAESQGLNLGSTFTVELPLCESKKADRLCSPTVVGKSSLKATEGARILVVDDHLSTRNALGSLLGRRGFSVLTAGTVSEARSLAEAEKIDFIISDIGLPDGSGNDLMAELRDRYELRGIALTGYGMEEDIAKARRSGFVTHLTKPVDMSSLEKAIELMMSGHGS